MPIIITLPPAGETGYRELILLPPSDSGLKPIYIMFNNPRKLPGEVTGYGEEINGHWLNPSSRKEGAPIPAQIADILRGQTFSNFDVFREAFWIAVANNPELSKEFSSRNLSFMKRGYSPFVPNKDKAGGREKYELHHIKSIKDGGAVFDVDNIGVLTPKRHIEIHTKKG